MEPPNDPPQDFLIKEFDANAAAAFVKKEFDKYARRKSIEVVKCSESRSKQRPIYSQQRFFSELWLSAQKLEAS